MEFQRKRKIHQHIPEDTPISSPGGNSQNMMIVDVITRMFYKKQPYRNYKLVSGRHRRFVVHPWCLQGMFSYFLCRDISMKFKQCGAPRPRNDGIFGARQVWQVSSQFVVVCPPCLSVSQQKKPRRRILKTGLWKRYF